MNDIFRSDLKISVIGENKRVSGKYLSVNHPMRGA